MCGGSSDDMPRSLSIPAIGLSALGRYLCLFRCSCSDRSADVSTPHWCWHFESLPHGRLLECSQEAKGRMPASTLT